MCRCSATLTWVQFFVFSTHFFIAANINLMYTNKKNKKHKSDYMSHFNLFLYLFPQSWQHDNQDVEFPWQHRLIICESDLEVVSVLVWNITHHFVCVTHGVNSWSVGGGASIWLEVRGINTFPISLDVQKPISRREHLQHRNNVWEWWMKESAHTNRSVNSEPDLILRLVVPSDDGSIG